MMPPSSGPGFIPPDAAHEKCHTPCVTMPAMDAALVGEPSEMLEKANTQLEPNCSAPVREEAPGGLRTGREAGPPSGDALARKTNSRPAHR